MKSQQSIEIEIRESQLLLRMYNNLTEQGQRQFWKIYRMENGRKELLKQAEEFSEKYPINY